MRIPNHLTAALTLTALACASSPATPPPAQLAAAPPDTLTISAGLKHTCALQRGVMSCWGSNSHGQLGVETTLPNYTPRPVLSDASMIAVGVAHTCALRAGALDCWGSNSSGQLGIPVFEKMNTPTPAPQRIFASGVTMIAAGANYTCAVHQGALKCWGDNGYGQLGTSGQDSRAPHAPQTIFEADVTALTAGGSHTCAVHQGALKCWGNNELGQVGAPPSPAYLEMIARGETMRSAADLEAPTPHTALPDGVTAVAAGGSHTCAIQRGALKCWGNNEDGALGVAHNHRTREHNHEPQLALPDGVTAVAAGGSHTCAIQRGALICWGADQYGQLDAPPDYGTPPRRATVFPSGVSAVAAGGAHTCAVHEGALKCWGHNRGGQLGVALNSGEDTPTPQQIVALP